MKIACSTLSTFLGDCPKNQDQIQQEIAFCATQGASFLVLPPLCITGYTCGELFAFPFFLQRQLVALQGLRLPPGLVCVTTIMEPTGERAYAFDQGGEVGADALHGLGVHLCQTDADFSCGYWNLLPTAHPWTLGSKDALLHRWAGNKVAFASCGRGESTAHRVYSGICGAVCGQGVLLGQQNRVLFECEQTAAFCPIAPSGAFKNPKMPFVPTDDAYLQEAVDILSAALRRRLDHMKSDRVVLGVSGGLDSTLALLLCHRLIPDKRDIFGLTLPGFGTTPRTLGNAQALMGKLGITAQSISIVDATTRHLQALAHPIGRQDVVYQNAQARERMQILFDYANSVQGIVVGSSDMSEAMLGFTTFGGDHLCMYNLLGGVPKTLVQALLGYFIRLSPGDADPLPDILATPISPELLPTPQPTEKIIGDYLYHDFYMYHTLVHHLGREELSRLFERTFGHPPLHLDDFYRRMVAFQFKRNCAPDSPQLLCVNLSPDYFALPSDMEPIF